MGQSVYICIYLQDIIKNYTLAQVDGQWSSVTAALSYLLVRNGMVSLGKALSLEVQGALQERLQEKLKFRLKTLTFIRAGKYIK